jgi:transposase
LLADKGYDTNAIRADLARRKIQAVTPAKSNRREKSTMTGSSIASATASSAHLAD